MPNEKQNDPSDWKNKLEEPGIFPPEEMMDKNAAWEKLHRRLREKPRRNKVFWYWAAAASLVVIFLLQIIFLKKNEQGVAKNVFPQYKKQQPAVTETSPAAEKQTAKIIIDLPVGKRQVTHVTKKASNNDLPVENDSIQNTPVTVSNQALTAIDETASLIPVPSKDTALLIATKKSVKKKLQVVHINELGNSPDEMALSASNHPQGLFGIWLGGSNQITNKPNPAGRDYAGLIKIKIASN